MRRLLYLLLLVPACYAVPSNILRPCALTDHDCIGGWLAGNSVCTRPVTRSMPKNYTIASFPFYTASFNASYIDTNLSISDHNTCFVSEFFFNSESSTCVMALRCLDLTFESTRTLIQHYPEREDTTYSFDYKGTYPELILTINIRPSSDLNICKAPVFAYVSSLPEFNVTPNDKPTEDFLTRDLTLLNYYERETFFYRGAELFRYYVNTKICDFNCDF